MPKRNATTVRTLRLRALRADALTEARRARRGCSLTNAAALVAIARGYHAQLMGWA